MASYSTFLNEPDGARGGFYNFLRKSENDFGFNWEEVNVWFQNAKKVYPLYSSWLVDPIIDLAWKRVWNLYVDTAFKSHGIEKIQLVALNIRRYLIGKNQKVPFFEEKVGEFKNRFLSIQNVLMDSPRVHLDRYFFEMFDSQEGLYNAFLILKNSGFSDEELMPHAECVVQIDFVNARFPDKLLGIFPSLEGRLRETPLWNAYFAYFREGPAAGRALLYTLKSQSISQFYRTLERLCQEPKGGSVKSQLDPSIVNLFCLSS